MTYLAPSTITAAISRLKSVVHPFLGITFMACKKAELPVGVTQHLRLDELTRQHLDQYHLFAGLSELYFQPFKSIKSWIDRRYPSSGLQAINTQTFKDVLLHPRAVPEWGFAENYIPALVGKLRASGYRRKPALLDLAIWFYREADLGIDPAPAGLIDRFVTEFNLTPDEIDALFDKTVVNFREGGLTESSARPVDYLKTFDPPPDAPSEVGGSLKSLDIQSVGAADELQIDIADRLTLITGDNGLGKSFLLECAWWASTGEWLQEAAYPGEQKLLRGHEPAIEFTIEDARAFARTITVPYSWQKETWVEPADRPRLLALGIFSGADGSFAVYDPTQSRNPRRRRHSLTLSQDSVWGGSGKDIEGIVRDWARWQANPNTPQFELLKQLMAEMSPDDLGTLSPGEIVRIPGDRRDMPTVRHAYGTSPILFESDGVKRILGLAYLIAWTISEHRIAAARRQEAPLDRVILVIDEIESHLHPKWQRTILPAVLRSIVQIEDISAVQLIVATHSPLVLSSIEDVFDEGKDASYHFDLEGGKVTLEPLKFEKQGDVSRWITSPFIGLRYARSKSAERAIAEAKRLQEAEAPDRADVQRATDLLKSLLPATDTFWPRWIYFARQHGADI